MILLIDNIILYIYIYIYINICKLPTLSTNHGKEHAHQNHDLKQWFSNACYWGFPGGAVVENLPANAGDTGSSPGLGRSHMPRSN